jgi:hypothetical protein
MGAASTPDSSAGATLSSDLSEAGNVLPASFVSFFDSSRMKENVDEADQDP